MTTQRIPLDSSHVFVHRFWSQDICLPVPPVGSKTPGINGARHAPWIPGALGPAGGTGGPLKSATRSGSKSREVKTKVRSALLLRTSESTIQQPGPAWATTPRPRALTATCPKAQLTVSCTAASKHTSMH